MTDDHSGHRAPGPGYGMYRGTDRSSLVAVVAVAAAGAAAILLLLFLVILPLLNQVGQLPGELVSSYARYSHGVQQQLQDAQRSGGGP